MGEEGGGEEEEGEGEGGWRDWLMRSTAASAWGGGEG